MEFSVSNVISNSLTMFRQRLGGLVGLWAVYFGAQIGISLIMGLGLGASMVAFSSLENAESMGAGAIVGLILFYAVYLLVYGAQIASLNAKASSLLDMSFGDALNRGIRAAPTILGITVLFLIGYLVGAIPLGLLGAAMAFLGVVGTVIFAAVAIGIVLYFACRLGTAIPIVAVEGVMNPITAITRSWRISEGKVLGIFGAYLAYIAIMIIVLLIIGVPFYFMLPDPSNPEAGIGAIALLIPIGLIAIIFISILSAAFTASIHAELSDHGGEALGDVFE